MKLHATQPGFDARTGGELSFRPAEEWQARQLELLRRHLTYLAGYSPYYRRVFAEAGCDPARIETLEQLAELPLTDKAQLATHQQEFCCVPESEVVDLCLTSGTTGEPVALAQTRQDLERVGYNEELAFRAAGIDAADRVLVGAALDRCFMAGLAYFLGLTRIGATAVRAGSGSPALLAELVRRQRPTALVGVPSLLLTLAGTLQQRGCDPARLGVRRIVCIGEPVRTPELALSPLGERLQASWQAEIFGTYASTEMATAFCDCSAGRGGHLLPELMLVEIVDDAGRVLPPGTPGEVVATPLQVTGMPLLRFRTGDIATLHAEPCPCGRQTPRLGPVLGRKSQMLKVRGTTVYPPAVFAVLQELDGVQGAYLEVRRDFDLSDRLKVVVGVTDSALSAAAIAERLAARLRVRPEVETVPPEAIRAHTLREDQRKPVTFFDLRGR